MMWSPDCYVLSKLVEARQAERMTESRQAGLRALARGQAGSKSRPNPLGFLAGLAVLTTALLAVWR